MDYNLLMSRWVETAVCDKHHSDSFRVSVCKSCLEPGFTAGICPRCGIMNWIGVAFMKNPDSIRHLEYKWKIPHGGFIPEFKHKIIQFKLQVIIQFIKLIK
jgi:hypothetical protein